MDPPSFSEFIRSSDPLDDNILGTTQPVPPSELHIPPPKPYFGPTIGTTNPRKPRPATAIQTMAQTMNLIYAHVTQLSSQMKELREENKTLRTITGGLRGDINRAEKKIEKAYKVAIDNLERGNVTGDLVEFIHQQECKGLNLRRKPNPSPAAPRTLSPPPPCPCPNPPVHPPHLHPTPPKPLPPN